MTGKRVKRLIKKVLTRTESRRKYNWVEMNNKGEKGVVAANKQVNTNS